jgi:hypothetical protein
MLQRIFWGDFNIATMLMWFVVFYVIKILLAVFLGNISIFTNMVLSFIIGFGFVHKALNDEHATSMTKIFLIIVGSSQIGTLITHGV